MPQHLTIEVAGTAGLQQAWPSVRDNPACVALSGTVSDPLATQLGTVLGHSSLPIVRRYREVLSRLYDEPPTALGLAGYIAAHYTFRVLQEVEGVPTRSSVLAAFQRRRAVDVGGFGVRFDAQRRSASFVTQSMLTAQGRVVG